MNRQLLKYRVKLLLRSAIKFILLKAYNLGLHQGYTS